MRKALFIYNPGSGKNQSQRPEPIISYLSSKGIETSPFYLSGAADEARLMNILKREHFDLAVISGGDGTINFAINVFVKSDFQIPVGIIPAGTSNDLARNLKIPLEQRKAADLIVIGETTNIDIGRANEDIYFMSSCGGGLFTDISYKTEGALKKRFGPLAYYFRGVEELYRISPFTLSVKTQSGVFEEDILLFFILNGPNVAGLSDLVKGADPADGLLHLVLIKKCTMVDLAGLFLKILKHLSLRGSDKVKIISAPEFQLESKLEIPLSVDGEKRGTLPAKLVVVPQRLTVFTTMGL
ncbi:MAG: diacylglycerol/lipid kinase family protein [Bacillota bacterium]